MPPRKKKDPNAPKKGLTDFMLFQQDMRAKVKKENPTASFGEIGKLLGEMWKELDAKQKKVYQEKSLKDKERYRTEKEKYDKDHADDDQSSEDDDNKPAAKKRAKKDPNKPKGALSAYMFFNREIRPQVASENPDAPFGEVGKLIGQKWKDLSADQKKKYEAMAAKDKKRYEAEMQAYNKGGAAPAKAAAAAVEDNDDDDQDDDDDDDDDDDE